MNQAAANLARLINPNPFDVRSAQAAVDQARATLQSRQSPTREDIQIAAAQVEQAAASLEAARVNQAEAVVRAPFNGIVSQRPVSAGATVGTNSPIVTLVSKETEIILQVEEARIGQVERNQPAQITVAAYPGEASRARSRASPPPPTPATARSPSASTRTTRRAGSRRHVRPGRAPDPAAPGAAGAGPGGRQPAGRNVVFVVGADSRVREREVAVGINDGRQVEILSGLQAGEEVAISALDTLSDGAPVVATREG